jgi:hypothetical protein
VSCSCQEQTHFTIEWYARSELFINNNEISTGFVPKNGWFPSAKAVLNL